MKKLLFVFGLFMLFGMTQTQAQLGCSNDNAIEARINAIEAAGFTEINREVFYVNYLLPPTPPYLYASMVVTFVGPYCGPACTPIMRTEYFDATVVNNNGNCVWEVGGGNAR